MKEYRVAEKQLEKLKNLVENYKEISEELCGEITLKVPTQSGRDMDRILDGLSPFEDDTETLKNRIESVASDLLSDAAAGLDEASIQDLQERLQGVERELSYLIEDIENQPIEQQKEQKTLLEVVGGPVAGVGGCEKEFFHIHTPGPWMIRTKRHDDGIIYAYCVGTKDERDIATIAGWGAMSKQTQDIALANAQLVAAAPELYAMLVEILKNGCLAFDEMEEKARNVVNKISTKDDYVCA